MKLLLGFVLGLLVGFLGLRISEAAGAHVVGSGVIVGWEVVSDGDVICSDPIATPGLKEIECD